MKFGVGVQTRGQQGRPELMTRFAQRAEALGFACLTVSDHIVLPKAMPANYPYHPRGEFSWQAARDLNEPLTALTFLTGKTNRIRLGPSVLILSYRNPVSTAKVLSTMDVLSEGRMFLGIGTGWWEDEYKALGIAEHFADRGARTDEYLRIYKALWTQENPEFKGRYHQFGDLEFSPKPRQQGGLPVWVGGHTTRALRRVVELGDVWHPIGLRPPAGLDPKELRARRDELHRMCEQAQRDPASVSIAFRCPVSFSAGTPRRPMAGTPAQVREDVQAYRQAGADQIVFDVAREGFDQTMEVLEQVAAEILPHFAG